jgi:hypothetical protein
MNIENNRFEILIVKAKKTATSLSIPVQLEKKTFKDFWTISQQVSKRNEKHLY